MCVTSVQIKQIVWSELNLHTNEKFIHLRLIRNKIYLIVLAPSLDLEGNKISMQHLAKQIALFKSFLLDLLQPESQLSGKTNVEIKQGHPKACPRTHCGPRVSIQGSHFSLGTKFVFLGCIEKK